MSDPIVFVCSHGARYTAFECEMGMTFAAMEAEMVEQEAEWNFNSDINREVNLARRSVLGELDCPWPWYADDPTEVIEHEEFGP